MMYTFESGLNIKRIQILREIVLISNIDSKKLNFAELPSLDISTLNNHLNDISINHAGLNNVLEDFGKKLCEEKIVNFASNEQYSEIAIEFLENHIQFHLHNV